MKARKVLGKVCALSLAVMLVGVNSISVMAAETNAPKAEEQQSEYSTATVTVDLSKGYFEGYGSGVRQLDNPLDAENELRFLPKVVANEGYEWTGWYVTDKAGKEVYDLDTMTSSICFPEVNDYTVAAKFSEVKPEEPKSGTAKITIDLSKGYFEGYGSETSYLENVLDANNYIGFLPKVVANEGYEWTGWYVTDKAGKEVYDLDTMTSSIYFPAADDYVVAAKFSEVKPEEPENGTATVTVDLSKGYFEGYGSEVSYLENTLDAENYLGFLPNVIANEGYEWTGWYVTDKAGNEVYDLDTMTSSIYFPAADDYTVTAKLSEVKQEERTVTVNFNVDSAQGRFVDPADAEVVTFENIPEFSGDEFLVPQVEANEGYVFTGWQVEGKETGHWDADAKTFGVCGLAHFPEGSNVGYIVATAQFEKVEAPAEPAEPMSATVVINPEMGSFEGFDGATELHNENLQDADYTLGFLPNVIAEAGYTWTGWEVTNAAGEVIYTLDTNSTSIAFPYGVADDYVVTAQFEKVEAPAERTVSVAIAIDAEKGEFVDYGHNTVHFDNLPEFYGDALLLPEVKAYEGYRLAGWLVEGKETLHLDANATTLGICGLAHFPEGSDIGYISAEPVFEEVETPVEPADPMSATVVINPEMGSFEGFDGATELHNENLQDADYTLGFLPNVIAEAGYTWTGWEVTNAAGEVIYTLDTNSTSIAFPYGVADDYVVTATFEKVETPVDPENPENPENPEKPENPDKPSVDSNGKTNNTTTKIEKTSETVQTGDQSMTMTYVATLLVATMAMIVVVLKKRYAK